MRCAAQKLVQRLVGGQTTPAQERAMLRALEGREPDRPDPIPLLLTQADAARLLNCSRFTVRRMQLEGTLEPVFLRGLMRFRYVDIERLAAEGTRRKAGHGY